MAEGAELGFAKTKKSKSYHLDLERPASKIMTIGNKCFRFFRSPIFQTSLDENETGLRCHIAAIDFKKRQVCTHRLGGDWRKSLAIFASEQIGRDRRLKSSSVLQSLNLRFT